VLIQGVPILTVPILVADVVGLGAPPRL